VSAATLRARNGVAIRTAPNEGRRRQSFTCRCGKRVRYYTAPRLPLCWVCWAQFWSARGAIIRERLVAEFPSGRAHPDYLQAEARLRNHDRSIPDAEILARLGWAL